MGILTQEVEIRTNSKNVKYYESLGYDIPTRISKYPKKGRTYVYDYNKPIIVKTKDLPRYSKSLVECSCDYCTKTKSIPYCQYADSVKENGKYACADCRIIKSFDITQSKYGVNGYASTKEFREKVAETFLNKYGCKNISQSSIIKEKKAKTFYQNSSQKSSRQQRYINDVYQGILNFSVKYYSADIYLSDDNLIIEFDGSGHILNVTTGRETMEEHNQKEIIRSNIIKREGYKQMRIISSTDKLPSDQVLLEMLDYARNYFSLYPNHSWIEFSIDTSTVRNAEHKDGIPYSFGELRRIKDSDLPNSTKENTQESVQEYMNENETNKTNLKGA